MQNKTHNNLVKRAIFYLLIRPIRIVTGTARIATQIAEINTRLQPNRADVEDNLERALAKVIDARLEVIQRRSAGLQATLSATLQRPMQECLDDVVRNVIGPLVSATVQNEMSNLNLQIDRMIRLNAPLILPSLMGGHENYQSMVRAFLRRLKPSATKGTSKNAMDVPGLPSIVVASTEPRKVALLSVAPDGCLLWSGQSITRAPEIETSEAVTWSERPGHWIATISADASDKALSEALREPKLENCEPILYVDLSGGELNFIDRVSPGVLGKFNQIVIVLYDMSNLHAANFLQAAAGVLDRIESNFRCIHIHARNIGGLCSVQNIAIPNIIELTYANRSKFEFTDDDEIYPTAIDVPTASNMADIYLGRFIY